MEKFWGKKREKNEYNFQTLYLCLHLAKRAVVRVPPKSPTSLLFPKLLLTEKFTEQLLSWLFTNHPSHKCSRNYPSYGYSLNCTIYDCLLNHQNQGGLLNSPHHCSVRLNILSLNFLLNNEHRTALVIAVTLSVHQNE